MGLERLPAPVGVENRQAADAPPEGLMPVHNPFVLDGDNVIVDIESADDTVGEGPQRT
jgi:hypothetical protein